VNETIGNSGNGLIAKAGKYSWVITIIAVLMGPFGSYMLFRQEMLVEVATIQLQISENSERLKQLEKKVDEGMVPKVVHDTRIEMQREVDSLREEINRLRAENNSRRIDELIKELPPRKNPQ
jgi:HAMP domain-containing protein